MKFNLQIDARRAKAVCIRAIIVASTVYSLQGCAVIAVADAAVVTLATGVKTTVKAVGSVVSAAIP